MDVDRQPPEPRARAEALDVLVTAERVKALYSKAAVALATVVLNSTLVAYVLWGAVSNTALVAWVGTLYAVTLARLVLVRTYHRDPPAPAAARRWGRLFCVGAAANGLTWGAAALALYPSGNVLLQVFLAFVIGGMTAGAAGSSATFLPAFASFAVPALAPISLRLFSEGSRAHTVMGIMLALFGFAVAQIAWTSGRRLTVLTELQVKNRMLVSNLEERVAERTAALQAANRAKDEFLATVSHELRTPLSAIIGWLHVLKSAGVSTAKREHALQTIERSAMAQAKLVEDLLDLSRVTSGTPNLDVRIIDPRAAVRAAVDAMRPAAEANGVRLDVVLDATSGLVHADAARIQQIVSNLLGNAIKFTPRGGHAAVDLRRSGSWLEIVVSDTGRGMAPEFLPFAFDQFRQADAGSTRSHAGLGLGLAISQKLARLHGGALEAHSEGLGRGATFALRLPIQHVPSPSRASSSPRLAPEATHQHRDLHGVDVLVVDDDKDTREVLVEIIEGAGATATAASGTEDALACLRRRRPDVIVSDLAMPGPGGDGLALVRAVRSLTPEAGGTIPAVSLTAHAGVEARTNALEAGYDGHLSKPVRSEQLLEEIATRAGLS